MKLADPKLPTSLGPSDRGPRFSAKPPSIRRGARLLAVLALAALFAAWPQARQQTGLGNTVAEGVALYQLNDPALLSPPGPIAVQLLKLDPKRVTLALALAGDRSPALETVVEMANRREALAAVNAGFFVVSTGAPAGLLKVGGRVLGATERQRGAVGIQPASGGRPLRLVFDQVAVTRHPRKPDVFTFRPRLGSSPKDWARARDVVGGAGLLRRGGRSLRPVEWVPERLRDGFTTERHPRTMIGADRSGAIWLITVDGRNPLISLGMTFLELQRLAERVGLRDALNLDGGGSTTMVVRGQVVNHPSDPTGPRRVSDGILVFPR